MEILKVDFPWSSLVTMLNSVLHLHKPNTYTAIESPHLYKPPANPCPFSLDIAGNHSDTSPSPDDFRPFPEEWAMQGLSWTQDYFPPAWFHNHNVETEKHYMEAESMRIVHRPERVLWLGVQIANCSHCIGYNQEAHTFVMRGTREGESHAPMETMAEVAS